MTRNERDDLAARAMASIVSSMSYWDLTHSGDYLPEEDTASSVIAERAYEIADEMIKRKK